MATTALPQRLLDRALAKYRTHPAQFTNKDACYVITSPARFRADWAADGYALFPTKPTPRVLQSVELLDIAAKYDALPAFVARMPRLECLRTPLASVWNVTDASLPASLGVLGLVHDRPKVAAGRVFPDVRLPRVRALAIISAANLRASDRVDGRIGISARQFPKLEYLRCSMDDRGQAVELLRAFSSLVHVCIGGIDKHDIVDALGRKLRSLHVEGAGPGFAVERMHELPALEMLRFNSIRRPLDCEDLARIPKLREVFVYNTSTVRNIEALLDVATLESLEVLSCRGALTTAQKKRFEARGFKRLRIDYA